MFKFSGLTCCDHRAIKTLIMSFCFLCSLLFAPNLFSQDYGGFTDPKTPGRHSRLNIDSAKIEVVPHGIYAEVSTEFWYRPIDLTSETDTLEMYALFTLPATDFINDSWLWVKDTLVRAMILDVNAATLIYENIVHRLHKDPSILYRRSVYGNYEYRIFPNVGNESRHARISYYTKMTYKNGLAQFTFTPTILNIATNKYIQRSFKLYLNDNFTDIDLGSNPSEKTYSSDKKGNFVQFFTATDRLSQTIGYNYDFSQPYFSKSKPIDEQEYYFAMFDSKLFTNKFKAQKINFLIDYDLIKTTTSAKDMIEQLKKAVLSNFTERDSINIMFGNKRTVNLFNRWVPCHPDTINNLIHSTIHQNAGLYSNLAELVIDGISFNKEFKEASSIVLLTSSEFAPLPATANPIIEDCLSLMSPNQYKITCIDFSDVHYSTYNIESKNYYGNQYFNQKISEMTRSDYYTVKGTGSSVFSMLNNAFTSLRGIISDVGLYVEPANGITISKFSENIVDENANKNLIYEYGKIVGGFPIQAKFSALSDGIPVIQNFSFEQSNTKISSESAKMWNWKHLRYLEDKKNKTNKESRDLVSRSITNRILTMQTAFLCLEPWMMSEALVGEKEDDENPSFVIERNEDAGIEVACYPVPAENFMNIKVNITNEYSQLISMAIYDVMGNKVKEFKIDSFNKSIELDWDLYSDNNSKLAPGVYYLKIKTSAGCKTLKFIVV